MQLSPSETFIRDLKCLAEISESQVTAIADSLRTDDGKIHRPEGLIAEVAQHVDASQSKTLVRQLLSLSSMRLQTGTSHEEVSEKIRQAIHSNVNESDREEAERGLNVLLQLQTLPNVERTSRAIDLSYDCSNLLQQTRILTDVRPLFSVDGTEIEGAVVAHTLRVRFDSASIPHESSFALDDRDLRLLREQCDRALTKADTARLLLCEKAGVPPLKSQGETDV